MQTTVRATISCTMLSTLLFSASLAAAQEPTPAPPVPAQVITANKVFVSNAGDDIAVAEFKKLGDVNFPYNQFYAELKKWGRYELVAAPADADLVFEIRFVTRMVDCGSLPTYQSQFVLTIFNARTRFILYDLKTLATPRAAGFPSGPRFWPAADRMAIRRIESKRG